MFCRYVGMSGSRERDSNGLHLEHVARMGSTFAAAQKRRQCSTKLTCNTYFLWCAHPRDLTTDPCVHFYGSPSPNRSGGTGRTSKPSTPYPRIRKGVNSDHYAYARLSLREGRLTEYLVSLE